MLFHFSSLFFFMIPQFSSVFIIFFIFLDFASSFSFFHFFMFFFSLLFVRPVFGPCARWFHRVVGGDIVSTLCVLVRTFDSRVTARPHVSWNIAPNPHGPMRTSVYE